MKFFKEEGVLTGLRLEDPIGRRQLFSHVGEYTSTPRHQIPLHDHPNWEFLLQTVGETSWQQGRQVCPLAPGDLLVCPPHLPHSLARAPRGNFRITFFGCSPARVCPDLRLESQLPRDRLTVIPGGRRTLPALRHLIEESFTEQHGRRLGALLALQRVLLEIDRLAIRSEPVPNHPQHPVILRLKSLIHQQPGHRWRLPDVARVAGYAPNYVAVLFRQETGQTLHAYITQVRLEAARSLLLSSSEPVTRIALQTGFSSSQHFARVFRAHFGSPASTLRRKLARAVRDR